MSTTYKNKTRLALLKKVRREFKRSGSQKDLIKAGEEFYSIPYEKGWRKSIVKNYINSSDSEKDKFCRLIRKYSNIELRKKKEPRAYKKKKHLSPKQRYKLYLKSPHWKRVKEHFKGQSCLNCGETKRIQIHHTTYENKGKLKKEINDCIPLCGKCHKEVHDYHKDNKDLSLKEATEDILHK